MMSRRWLVVCLGAVVIIGLLSRWDGAWMPGFVRSYAGDTLWATMVTLGLALIRPGGKPEALALLALGIAFAVEFTQLCRAPWIDAIRATVPGHLVLGQGFLWSDLACYVAGVVLGHVLLGSMPRVPD